MEASNSDISAFNELLPAEYKIIEQLGAGGSGTVFKAYYSPMQQHVAVKLFTKSVGGEQGEIERLRKEAKAIAMLDHPNIVRVLHTGMAKNDTPYLVYEYIEGQDLLTFFSGQSKLNREQLSSAIQQICDGLAYVHEKGIVHRDIKPANVVISQAPEGIVSVKILDFGLARIDSLASGAATNSTSTKTGAIKGSPQYMSPEQCKGQKVDKRSDIYSLGCVLFEILAKRPVYDGETQYELLYKHISAPVPVPQKFFSNELNVFFSICLAKEISDRQEDISKFNHEFKNALDSYKEQVGGNRKSSLAVSCVAIICLIATISYLTKQYRTAPQKLEDIQKADKLPGKVKESLSNEVHDAILRAESSGMRSSTENRQRSIHELNQLLYRLNAYKGLRDYSGDKYICYSVIADLKLELLDYFGAEKAFLDCAKISDKWAPPGQESLHSFKSYMCLSRIAADRNDQKSLKKYLEKAEKIYKAVADDTAVGKELPFNYQAMNLIHIQCGLSAIQCHYYLKTHQLDLAENYAKRGMKDTKIPWGSDLVERPFLLYSRVLLAKGKTAEAEKRIADLMDNLSVVSKESARSRNPLEIKLFDPYEAQMACTEAFAFVRKEIKKPQLELKILRTSNLVKELFPITFPEGPDPIPPKLIEAAAANQRD